MPLQIDQGQLRVTIYINIVNLESSMVHCKFMVIYGHCGYLGHVTKTIFDKSMNPVSSRPLIIFGFERLRGCREENA